MKIPFRKPKPAMRVRIQHEMLDNAAIEGLWVGNYVDRKGQTYLHLRASRTLIAGQDQPFRHGEILIPEKKVVFMEILAVDANPHPNTLGLGETEDGE